MKKRMTALLLALSLSASLICTAGAVQESTDAEQIAAVTEQESNAGAQALAEDVQAQLEAGETGVTLEGALTDCEQPRERGVSSSSVAETYSEILPYTTNHNLSVPQGSKSELNFLLFQYGGANQKYKVAIVNAANNKTMGTLDGAYAAEVSVKSLNVSFDTSKDRDGNAWPVGTYRVLCYTYDENGSAVESQQFEITVTSASIANTGVYFYDANGKVTTEATLLMEQANTLYCVGVRPYNCSNGRSVTITNSNDGVAEARILGSYAFITPKAYGTTTLTATNELGYSSTLTITVSAPVPATGITLSPATLTLQAGESSALEATVFPANATDQSITWASSAPSVATVDANGNVVGLKEGIAVITATCGGYSTRCTVTVTGSLLPFTDLVPGSWYYASVRYATSNGLFYGLSDTAFGPDNTMTRGMLVAVLYRMAGSPGVSSGSPFVDVAPEDYYHNAVIWANSVGIAYGRSSTIFDPDSSVSRQEMACFLYRYYTRYRGQTADHFAEELDGFSDYVLLDSWAAESMSWAVGNGLIAGIEVDVLGPTGNATRAQVAAILTRYCNAFGK